MNHLKIRNLNFRYLFLRVSPKQTFSPCLISVVLQKYWAKVLIGKLKPEERTEQIPGEPEEVPTFENL